MLQEVKLNRMVHRDQDVISIAFDKDFKLIRLIKQLPAVKYSLTHRCWYVPYKEDVVSYITRLFSGVGHIVVAKNLSASVVKSDVKIIRCEGTITEVQQRLMTLVAQKLNLKGYSDNTKRVYCDQLKSYFAYIGSAHPAEVQEEMIRNYLLYLIDQRKISRSTQNQAINAIKFLYESVFGEPRRVYYLERPLKERRLPQVMNLHELQRLFLSCENEKHRLMLEIEEANFSACALAIAVIAYIWTLCAMPRGQSSGLAHWHICLSHFPPRHQSKQKSQTAV